MPLTYTIDTNQRLITISGEYADAHDWTTLLAQIVHDPRREDGFGFLRDLRRATTPVDAATVAGIMRVVRGFWPMLRPSRAAILTPHDVDTSALTACAIADAEGLPFGIFNTFEEAESWLARRPRGESGEEPEAGA